MSYVIRPYKPADYEQVASLYKRSELYGGVFDESRDSSERLKKRVEADPDSIIVAEDSVGNILGTVSLIEDGRVAWLYRFCVVPVHDVIEGQRKLTIDLNVHATEVLKRRGHKEVLIYTSGNQELQRRYLDLGYKKGNEYTCFWKNLS